jgi:hypothetical protein
MLKPAICLAALLGLGCASSSPEPSARSSGGGGMAQAIAGGAHELAGATATGGVGAGAGAGARAGNGGVAGASGASAGSSGNASGAAGTAATDFCAARPGLMFCETFEAQAPGPAPAMPPWSSSINGEGELVIDDSTAHSGTRALKAHGAGFNTFLVLSSELLPSASGRLHVRSFVRMAEAMSAGHNTFIVADTQAAPGAGNAFRFGEMNGMLMYTVSGDTHGALANDNYYTDHMPGAAFQPMTWACLEVALDHQKPEIQVWLDGVEIADLHHGDWPLDPYDALRFGFEKYAGPVSDIWYDDIAIGSTRLGCN